MVKIKVINIFRYLAILIALILSLLPVFVVILNSFKSPAELQKLSMSFFFKPTLDNYIDIVRECEFLFQLKNTLFMVIVTVSLSAIIGIPAAYSLSRAKILFKNWIMFFVLLVRFLPYIMFIIPLFILMTRLGISGTQFSLFLTMMMIPLPITIWLMKGFFDDIPVDVEEAAYIDGSSRFGAFLRIVIPSATPGIAAIIVLSTIFTWNQLLIPLIMAGSESRTVIIGLLQFIGGETCFARVGLMSAWIVGIIVPAIIISLIVNKYMVKGFTQGVD